MAIETPRTVPTWVNPDHRDEFEDTQILDPEEPGRPDASRWRPFVLCSAPPTSREGWIATPEWWAANMPTYEGPSLVEVEHRAMQANRGRARAKKPWAKRLKRMFLRNPLVPLLLRLTIWTLSLAALILSVIMSQTMTFDPSRWLRSQRSAIWMAVIISSVSLLYLIFITYDEYSSKPLGLRAPSVKLRLVLLDLFFIVLMSVNLTQAIYVLDQMGRAERRPSAVVKHRQVALTALLGVALAAWLVTFVVTAFRLVARVARDAD